MVGAGIHDNDVVSYEVNGANRRIVLHTLYDVPERREFTDVIFDGVFAYYFEHDNFGNTLFGVEEVFVTQLVVDNRSLFEEGVKYAWPGPWNESPEASIDHFESNGAKGFEISSSYGLAGWAIAMSCRLEAAPGDAAG
jgi:hypothetical protein